MNIQRKHIYEAHVSRHDHWWEIHIPALGVGTASIHAHHLVDRAKKLIASFHKIPTDTIEVVVREKP